MIGHDVREEACSREEFTFSLPLEAECSAPLADAPTQILLAIEQRNGQATEQLLPLVYDELRKLAAAKMAREKPGQTLQPTALVHEAYLRLVRANPEQPWNSRGHFYAAAAEAMRRILVERVRSKNALIHGGDHQRVELPEADLITPHSTDAFLILNDAVDHLAAEDRPAGELAKLRLFAGLSVDEAAEILDLPHSTAYRHWTYARAWLQAQMSEQQ